MLISDSPSSPTTARIIRDGVVPTGLRPRPRALIWASKGRRHIFNYDLIDGLDPTSQISSVWRIPAFPRAEKRLGHHPSQKPLRLVRRALIASTREGDLAFEPFCGSGTTAFAAKELGRFFVSAELARRRVGATERGSVLRTGSRGRRVKLAAVGVGAGPEGKGNYRQGPAPAITLPGGDESAMNRL